MNDSFIYVGKHDEWGNDGKSEPHRMQVKHVKDVAVVGRLPEKVEYKSLNTSGRIPCFELELKPDRASGVENQPSISVQVWGWPASDALRDFRPGDLVLVEGQLREYSRYTMKGEFKDVRVHLDAYNIQRITRTQSIERDLERE